MTTPIPPAPPVDAATKEAMLRDLQLRIQNLSLEDVKSVEDELKKRPFSSLSTTVFIAKGLNAPDEMLREVVYSNHKHILELVEGRLTPAQLLFGYWFLFSAAKDGRDGLLQCVFLHACRVLEDDFSSQSFVPQPLSTEWIDVLREKLKGTTHFRESVDAFLEAIPAVKDDKFPEDCCRLQFWHIFCYLLTKAFPDILTQRAKAFEMLLTIKTPNAFAPISRGLKYLFQPPTNFPISYEGWANVPEPHAFALEGIVEYIQANQKTCSFKTLDQAVFAIEALLGDKASSETFADKIQGAYLFLFVRLAQGTSMPIALAAPLITRLCKENELQFSERIDAIDEVMSHVSVNVCEFEAGIKIYRQIFALIKKMQDERIRDERVFDCYRYEMQSVLEKMPKMRLNHRGAFSSEKLQLEDYSLFARPFELVREVRASFTAARKEFPNDSWPAEGERHVTIHYMKLMAVAIEKIKQLKKPGIRLDRWHEMIFCKNQLVLELIKNLYSLKPPFNDKFISEMMTPLLNVNVSSFGHELVFSKQNDLFLVGKRENVEVLHPLPKQNQQVMPTPQRPYCLTPGGSFVIQKNVKKLPPSSLAKEIKKEDMPGK